MQLFQMASLIISTTASVLIIYLILKLLKVADPRWATVTEDGTLADKDEKERYFGLSGDTATIPHSPHESSVEKYIDYVACAMRFQTEASRLMVYKLNQLVEIDEQNKKTLDAILKKP